MYVQAICCPIPAARYSLDWLPYPDKDRLPDHSIDVADAVGIRRLRARLHVDMVYLPGCK